MNPTTKRFPRTLNEAFPCDAQQAITLHRYQPPLTRRFFYAFLRWGWVAVLAAVFLLTGCDDLATAHAAAAEPVAAQQDSKERARRLSAAQQVCSPKGTAIWLDSKTIYCARHAVAAQ